MENLKQFTDNLSLNPYTRRSYSMKINSELFTANKSIIRAINEIYQNQKSIYNSIIYIYKKLNITIGNIVEDKELKEAYSSLQFANIIDGLVKLNDKIENTTDMVLMRKITSVEDIIKDPEADLNKIFNIMHWDNVIDALIKIDKKIADYMIQDTESASEEYIQIRDSITELINILGASDETELNKLQIKFENIIKAILTIDNFIGVSEENLQIMNNNGFVNMSHAINEISDRLSTATDNITSLNESQAENINNFTNLNNTIVNLTRDLQGLAASMGQATGTDLSNLGYTSIADGLYKLASTDRKLIEIIGDMDSEETSEYRDLNYANMADAIVKITKAVSAVTSVDVERINELNSYGYVDILDAVNDLIFTTGITEKNYLRENEYESIIDAIEKITYNLNNLQNEFSGDTGEMGKHKADLNAHPDTISGYFRHKTDHVYKEGEIVFIPELPNNLCLLCIKEGRTDIVRPNFKNI